MMSNHVSGHKRQRRMFLATAATASVLMAVSAPVAAASPSGGHPPKPPKPPSSKVQAPTSKVSAQTTVSNNTPTPTAPAGLKGPAGPDPNVGLNIGNPPPGMPGGTGNTDYGNQSNPASVQFYNLGTGNNNVANNVGTVPTSATSSGGPGVNLVNLGSNNDTAGDQTVNGTNNFGSNTAILGDNNSHNSGTNFINDAARTTSTGLFGSNLAFMVNGNKFTGLQELNGSNSAGIQVVFAGSGNGASGENIVNSVFNGSPVPPGPAFGANFASVGSHNIEAGVNDVQNTGGPGTTAFGANYAIVGDSAAFGNEHLGAGTNFVWGSNAFGTNWAVVMSTSANPTIDSGNNFVCSAAFCGPTSTNNSVFGNNFAIVGAGSTNVGNNLSAATGGGLNVVWAMGNNTDVGNNTGGGINIAIEGPGATDVGNCAAAACINIFGVQLL